MEDDDVPLSRSCSLNEVGSCSLSSSSSAWMVLPEDFLDERVPLRVDPDDFSVSRVSSRCAGDFIRSRLVSLPPAGGFAECRAELNRWNFSISCCFLFISSLSR